MAKGPSPAPRCAGSPAAPDRVERRDGVPAVEHAARPPLRGAGARRGGERNFSGTKAPSSGMGWPRCSPSRAHLDRSGFGPRSRACLLGPGTQDPSRGRAEARGVWVRFVFFFFFFPGRNPERTALGFPGAHLGPAPGERSRFLRFPLRAIGTCLVPPEYRRESPEPDLYREPPRGPASRREANASLWGRQSPGGWRGAWPKEKECFKGCFLPRPALPPVV